MSTPLLIAAAVGLVLVLRCRCFVLGYQLEYRVAGRLSPFRVSLCSWTPPLPVVLCLRAPLCVACCCALAVAVLCSGHGRSRGARTAQSSGPREERESTMSISRFCVFSLILPALTTKEKFFSAEMELYFHDQKQTLSAKRHEFWANNTRNQACQTPVFSHTGDAAKEVLRGAVHKTAEQSNDETKQSLQHRH